jgi:tetratricopeptide (TPR) repeat protein
MSNRGIVALVIGLAVVIGLAAVGLFGMARVIGDRRAAREARDAAEREQQIAAERDAARAEAAVVFAAPTRPGPAEIDEFGPFFADLGKALDRGDTASVTAAFDADRLLAELDRLRAFDQIAGGNAPAFKAGARAAINDRFGAQMIANELLRWARTDVRHVRWSADRTEVMVIAVHRAADADDVPTRMRWWLVRRGGGWKIYDLEDMHMGMRATRIAASLMKSDLLNQFLANPEPLQKGVAAYQTATLHIARGDVAGADAALAPARAIRWPAPLAAVVEVIDGMILMHRGEPGNALARFDAAERLYPNIPAVMLGRAMALIELHRPQEAIVAIRAYETEVGADALSATLEGRMHESQDKKAEAATAFRRALDELPDYADAFDGLRRVLPADKKGELGDRVAKLPNPRKAYTDAVQHAREADDAAAEAALLDGLLKALPDDTFALGEDVRRKVKAGKFAEARQVMARGLKLAKDDDRRAVLNAYLYAMIGANKGAEAYAAVPDPHARAAFRTLADDLNDEFPDPDDKKEPPAVDALRDLIAAHRARAADDPFLDYYGGVLLERARGTTRKRRRPSPPVPRSCPRAPPIPTSRTRATGRPTCSAPGASSACTGSRRG